MVKINPKLLLEAIYPVGSIFINTTGTNPSTFLGGTWEEFGKGRVLVGRDTSQTEFDTLGETGGSKELQAHHHEVYSAYGQGQGTSTTDAIFFGTNAIGNQYREYGYGMANFVKDAGSGNSGNLQPYVVVSMWKRTA